MDKIEVLIKIPKEDYEFIYDEFADGVMPDGKSLIETTLYAIANGTVLQGHGGLVELGKVIDIVTEYVPDDGGSVGNTNLKDLLYEVENMEQVIKADREA